MPASEHHNCAILALYSTTENSELHDVHIGLIAFFEPCIHIGSVSEHAHSVLRAIEKRRRQNAPTICTSTVESSDAR